MFPLKILIPAKSISQAAVAKVKELPEPNFISQTCVTKSKIYLIVGMHACITTIRKRISVEFLMKYDVNQVNYIHEWPVA